LSGTLLYHRHGCNWCKQGGEIDSKRRQFEEN
jgi:hypothetical protein